MILLIWALRGLAHLPRSLGYRAGALLGMAMMKLANKRRRICEINLRTCFPKLSASEHRKLVQTCFRELGIGVVETSWAWFRPASFVAQYIHVEGVQHIKKALADGHGVLLIGPHYTMLDLVAMIVNQTLGSLVISYRPQNNKAMDQIIHEKRQRFGELVSVKDLRTIKKRLNTGHIVWFSPDQDLGQKSSVFAPFFGRQTSTITTPARLSAPDKVTPIFLNLHRKEGLYHLSFQRFSDNYPSLDQVENATQLNLLIERAVAACPGQYLWIHRRFKTSNDSEEKSLYPNH